MKGSMAFVQIEEAKHMLEHKYVAKTKAAGVKQRIEVVTFSTNVESVGQIVTLRAKELNAAAVVRFRPKTAPRNKYQRY